MCASLALIVQPLKIHPRNCLQQIYFPFKLEDNPALPLTLLVFGIGATNMNDAFAPNHLAFAAHLFY